MMFWKFKHAVGKIEKGREKQNDGGWIWDTYRFTFGKGSLFRVWRAGPFSCCVYYCSACPGELDEDELATLRYTFFARLFLDLVVVGLGSGNSGASQIACPSSSCRFRMRLSSLYLNMKNMSSFPTRKQISPLPTCWRSLSTHFIPCLSLIMAWI